MLGTNTNHCVLKIKAACKRTEIAKETSENFGKSKLIIAHLFLSKYFVPNVHTS